MDSIKRFIETQAELVADSRTGVSTVKEASAISDPCHAKGTEIRDLSTNHGNFSLRVIWINLDLKTLERRHHLGMSFFQEACLGKISCAAQSRRPFN